MPGEILTLGLGIGAIFLAVSAVKAEGAQCADRREIVTALAETYGESRQSIGLTSGNRVIEVFASLETGTWTITITEPSGIACLVAAGEAFERLDEALLQGDPA